MHKLRKRQVHLDFHTNGTLTVGTEFSKEQFQAALEREEALPSIR